MDHPEDQGAEEAEEEVTLGPVHAPARHLVLAHVRAHLHLTDAVGQSQTHMQRAIATVILSVEGAMAVADLHLAMYTVLDALVLVRVLLFDVVHLIGPLLLEDARRAIREEAMDAVDPCLGVLLFARAVHVPGLDLAHDRCPTRAILAIVEAEAARGLREDPLAQGGEEAGVVAGMISGTADQGHRHLENL